VKVVWSPLAVDRVVAFAERIAEDRPLAAEQWVDEVFRSTARLERYPESGRVIPELPRHPDHREVITGRYRIIDRIEAERVLVLTVRHSRQLTGPGDLQS
jgi:toxin ParE1/3/4